MKISALALTLVAANSPIRAQNVAYRQRNLASDVTAIAPHVSPILRGPWGIAAVPQRFFLIASGKTSRVVTEDAKGLNVRPTAFVVPDLADPAGASVTGVVVDSNLAFAGADSNQFAFVAIVATAHGGIFFWGVDTQGNVPSEATLKVDNSPSGAVYTSLAILNPPGAPAKLAAADFHHATVQLFDTSFAPAGTLRDPSLPTGFAPFGMQVIGNQLFVTFAPQDAEKLNPIPGGGNGIVSVFDLNGHFVRRFATSGALDDPWGLVQAGAEFGPFANAILIGNTGDGVINAFDPANGSFLGHLDNGDGNPIRNSNLRGLIFGSQAFGDPNTLYFAAGINEDQDGLFASASTGLVSVTQSSAPPLTSGKSDRISVVVSAGPGNAGTPTGSVRFSDGSAVLGDVRLTDGTGSLDVTLTGTGVHTLSVRYGGDATFLPSTSQLDVSVNGFTTSVTLNAPSTSSVGASIVLTATMQSDQGIPTGQVTFDDSGTTIGAAPLNNSGVAVLRTTALAAGSHSLTARYEGDDKFSGSTSAPVTIRIAAADFSLSADRASATVIAGQSTQFRIAVAPTNGFADSVTFSCSAPAGVQCGFAPSVVGLNGLSATTTLTVSTSAAAGNANWIPIARTTALVSNLAFLFLFCLFLYRMGKRPRILRLVAGASLFATALLASGCGGSRASDPGHRTVLIEVKAVSGSIVHTTTLTVTVE